MRSRKVFRVLAALPEQERQAFGEQLSAQPNAQRPTVLALFHQICDEIALPPDQARSPEQIHSALPTDSQFSGNYFDKLCAALLKRFNDWLVSRELDRLKPLHAAMLLRGYTRLRLDEHIPALHKGLVQELAEAGSLDLDALDAQYHLEREYGMFLFRQPRTPAGEQLVRISQEMQASFIARALEIGIAILNYNKVFKLSLPVPDLRWAEAAMKATPDAWPLLLRVKLLGYKVLSDQDASAFHTLTRLLEAEAAQLGDDVRREMYVVALNFCAFRINQGDGSFLPEADKLYLRLLDAGWLLRDGLLPSEQFKNIVSLRLRLGELEWTERFIATYGQRLTNPHDGLALRYNQAVLAFYQGHHSECIRRFDEVVRDVKDDMYYGTDARVFLLKALYDRNLPDDSYLIDSQCNAFRVYIIRNKRLGETDQNQYLSFAKLYRKLLDLRQSPKGPEALTKLRAAQKALPLSDRHWFEARLAALEALTHG